MGTLARAFAARTTRLFVAAALAAVLGACSKCDVPTWPQATPPPGQFCHDGPTQ
jgi:hypothetical protein